MKMLRASSMSRRAALRSLTVGAGAACFWQGLNGRLPLAHAADAPPKRLLVLFHPNGLHENTGWGSWLKPGPTEEAFEYQGMTTPLARHQADSVFFDNLILASGMEYGDKHHTGRCLVLTGQLIADGERPMGPSIDQYIADKLGRIVTPRFPSVQLVSQEYDTYVSFAADGTCNPAIASPWTAYKNLFSGLDMNEQSGPSPALLQRLKLRKSVLDAVAKDVQRFQLRLPAEDRARAEAQLAAIRTMETRLSEPTGATPACSKPELVSAYDADDTKRFPELIRMYSDVIVSTLACDVSRVVMMNYRGGKARLPCDFAPINSPEEEHGLSHDYEELFVDFRKLLFEETAYIADQLKAIPEGTGTMLDNTIILCTTEISQGHQHGRMPWLTLGGKNLGVRTGRCLNLPKQVTDANNYTGYPHQKLLVSLMHALGMTDEASFGLPEFGTGPMAGYLG